MAPSPWILLTFLLQITTCIEANQHPKAVIRYPIQVVVDDSVHQNFTITLDGSLSTGGDFYEWKELEKPVHATAKTKFTSKNEPITNVTIGNENGLYKFRLRAKKINHRRSDAFSRVYVEKPSSVGMYLFSSTIVGQLLKMQYQYIALSQPYQNVMNYHPKVAEYFRKLSFDRAAMLHDVTTHILAKQVTEELIHSCPTDYIKVMMSRGFKSEINYVTNVTDVMTSSFDIAKDSETELGRLLVVVHHHAERNNDYELSDFVANNLLPRVTKVLNQHKNHLETTLRAVEKSPAQQRHFVEFLFDKYLQF